MCRPDVVHVRAVCTVDPSQLRILRILTCLLLYPSGFAEVSRIRAVAMGHCTERSTRPHSRNSRCSDQQRPNDPRNHHGGPADLYNAAVTSHALILGLFATSNVLRRCQAQQLCEHDLLGCREGFNHFLRDRQAAYQYWSSPFAVTVLVLSTPSLEISLVFSGLLPEHAARDPQP